MDIKKIIRSLISEAMDDQSAMLNSVETYYECGFKCGEAMSKRDQARASRQEDWFKRASSLEKAINKQKAIDAFKQGHADGRGVVKVDYLKEEHPPVKGGDKLMR